MRKIYISREFTSQKEIFTDILRSGSRGHHCTVYNKTHTLLTLPKIKNSGRARKYPVWHYPDFGVSQ